MGKTKRQLADEAYLRTEPGPPGPPVGPATPGPTHELPGQLGIDGSVIGEHGDGLLVDGIPETCPGCLKRMTVVSGWTASSSTQPRAQCGRCGYTVAITATALRDLKAAIQAYFASRPGNLPKPVAKPKRDKGAR